MVGVNSMREEQSWRHGDSYYEKAEGPHKGVECENGKERDGKNGSSGVVTTWKCQVVEGGTPYRDVLLRQGAE